MLPANLDENIRHERYDKTSKLALLSQHHMAERYPLCQSPPTPNQPALFRATHIWEKTATLAASAN